MKKPKVTQYHIQDGHLVEPEMQRFLQRVYIGALKVDQRILYAVILFLAALSIVLGVY